MSIFFPNKACVHHSPPGYFSVIQLTAVAWHRVTMGCRNILLFHNSRQAETSNRDAIYDNPEVHASNTYIRVAEAVDFCYPLLPRKTQREIHSYAKTELNVKVTEPWFEKLGIDRVDPGAAGLKQLVSWRGDMIDKLFMVIHH